MLDATKIQTRTTRHTYIPAHKQWHLFTWAAASVRPHRALEAELTASPNSGRLLFFALCEMPAIASPKTCRSNKTTSHTWLKILQSHPQTQNNTQEKKSTSARIRCSPWSSPSHCRYSQSSPCRSLPRSGSPACPAPSTQTHTHFSLKKSTSWCTNKAEPN